VPLLASGSKRPRSDGLDGFTREYSREDPKSLVEHPDNPRVGDVEAIVESIRANGFYGAIVAQRSTRRVLAGNHRLKAALALGMETVPVVWVDCDDAAAVRILLSDNKASDMSVYDPVRIADLLKSVPSLDGTLWDPDEAAKAIGLAAPFSEPQEGRAACATGPTSFVRIIVAVEDIALYWRAVTATGKLSQHEALNEICSVYLEAAGEG
jgi:hypothetical protein